MRTWWNGQTRHLEGGGGETSGGSNPAFGAIEAYRQAIRINPKSDYAWYCLGFAYSNLNRYNDAIEAYRQALRINPEYAVSWNNLAMAYDLSGNKTAALDAARELRCLDPEQADKLFNMIVPR